MSYRAAIIGTGAPGQSGRYAMGYRHARGYERIDQCELIACADVSEENAQTFARTFDIDRAHVFEDYEEMLAEAAPDIVSVCTPPKTHADIVIGCANSGVVRAVHSEKPMAATWRECRQMVRCCDRHGVQLTINHQRRFASPYQKAKSLLKSGTIGSLRRIEIGGQDLYDYGTHLFDMCGYMTDQTPVEWVMGTVDYRNPGRMYGMYQETQALARWHYESGVDGLASTGESGMIPCQLRLVGEDGAIEVGHHDKPPLRVRTDGGGWKQVDTGRDGIWRPQTHILDRILERFPVGPDRLLSPPTYVTRGLLDTVNSLREGATPELAAKNALQTTEIIFACWESARQRGRIELPLQIDDNPLQALVETDERVAGTSTH